MEPFRTFSAREHAIVLLFFAALGLVGMWPQAPPTAWARVTDPFDYDNRHFAVAMWWERQALLSAPLHVLDAPFFHPAERALTATDSALPISAATLPLAWIGVGAPFAYRLTNLIVIVAAGWGIWWFVARTTGDRWAGLLAGIVWAANPHTFLELNRINVMTAPAWAPLAAMLLADDEAPRARRFVAAFACLVFCAWTGWYMALFTAVFMACWCLAALATRRAARLRRMGRLALLGGLTALALVPMWLAYRGAADVVYFQGDLALRNRFFPWNLVVPGPGTLLGRALARPGVEIGEKGNEYAGVATLLVMGTIALAAFARSVRRPIVGVLADARLRTVVVFAALLVVAGCAFGLGPRFHVAGRDVWLPFAWLGWIAEPLRFSRWPARFGIHAMFGVATLAGIAFARLRIALPVLTAGARGKAIAATLCAVAFLDILAIPPKARKEVVPSPLLERLADRNDLRVVAEVPVRDMGDVTEAMISATMHRKAIPHGYSDIGFGPTNVEDFLNLWPAPAARAAMDFAGVDALLLVSERFDGGVAPAIAAGWRELDRDDQFVLVAPNGEMPAEAAALLADLANIPEPSPAIALDGPEFIARAWRDGLQLDGCRFVAGPDAMTAVDFDPPIDARRHRRVVVRMRLFSGPASPEATQIFWTSPTMPHANERRTARQPVPVDGEWHDIVFDFSRDPRWVWCGEISQIRWDPTHSSNYRGEIGGMRVE